MKNQIHPEVYIVKARCVNCSSTFETQTTKKVGEELLLDVCSKCHPFYVGKTALTKVAGRIDKFNTKVATSEQAPEAPKKVKATKAEIKKLRLSDLEKLNK